MQFPKQIHKAVKKVEKTKKLNYLIMSATAALILAGSVTIIILLMAKAKSIPIGATCMITKITLTTKNETT